MSDYSFMRSGFDNIQDAVDEEEAKKNIVAIIVKFSEGAMRTAAKYVSHSQTRNVVTPEDLKRGMMLEMFLFKHRNNFLSYCGLVKLQRESGGKNYGSKRPRYNRQLKTVFKTAALATIRGNGPFRKLYDHLVFEKRYPEYKARHAVAQKIAVATFGTMYSGKKFNPLEIGALKAVLTKA